MNGNDRRKKEKGQRRNGNTEIIQSSSEALKDSLSRTLPEDYLNIMQNDEECYLHPIEPFESIIKGPISEQILRALKDLNYKFPSRIQSQAIPILNYQKSDLIAQSQSGTGKTACFIISMLLHIDNNKKFPQAICLFSTHELCIQAFKLFTQFNKYINFKGETCLFNGHDNEEPPSKDSQLLFGTPSSITFWIKNEKLDVSNVKFLVIDEVDTILDKFSTFYPSTINLLKKCLPQDVQYGFFASTIKSSIIDYIKKIRPNILTIRLLRKEQNCKNIEHWYTQVDDIEQGKAATYFLIKSLPKGQIFVLTRSKKMTSKISDFLNENGIQSTPYSSSLSNLEREQTLDRFRNHEFNVLVTTDVLSHGIDVPDTFLVINFQTPITFIKSKLKGKMAAPDCDTYIHRAGLAGRFGRNGICFTIVVDKNEEETIKAFCSEVNLNIPLHFIEKFELCKLVDDKDDGDMKILISKVKSDKSEDQIEDNDIDDVDYDADNDYDDNYDDKNIDDDNE